MSDSKQSTYRSIFKATSLFGGLQLYLIFISIIKSKFIAILLGPLGVGIQGLFQSGTEVIRTLTNFGYLKVLSEKFLKLMGIKMKCA